MNEIKEKVKADYLKGLKYKEICEKYDLSINTLKSWIKRYKWSDEKKKGAHKNKRGAPLNNKNAIGNKGGAPPKNKNAEKHGFFSKYLPDETLEIIQEIEQKNPIDILWENIQIQYAAIIRAQKIMYVRDKEDITKHLKKEKDGDIFTEREWEFQYAWDKQANFLRAQSRAMSELRSMIKRYEEMLKSDLVTEEQKLRIQKLKAEINGPDEDNQESINEFIKATSPTEKEIKELFGDEEDGEEEEEN